MATEPANEDNATLLPKRVLLVDDDEILLKAFEWHHSKKMEVRLAVSAEEAMELLGKEEFPVIISDMYMGPMNGIDFIIAARIRSPQSIYMLLTASRDSETAVSALNDAGVFCIINKPCSMPDLEDFIDAAYVEYSKQFNRG